MGSNGTPKPKVITLTLPLAPIMLPSTEGAVYIAGAIALAQLLFTSIL